jgi:tetratricopeptide (TPR) repeat protein
LSLGIAHSRYSESQELLAKGALDEALKPASKAASSWTSSPAAQLNAGIIAGLIYQDEPTEVHLVAAKGFFDDAIAADPNSALAYANFAQLQLESGAEDDAVVSAKEALSRAKHDPVIAALVGSVFEAAGDADGAVSAYALAVANEPRLAQSLFWRTTPARMALRPRVIEASNIDACDQGLAAVLYGAYGDDLQTLLAECEARIAAGAANTDDRVGRVLLLSALGRSEDAIPAGRDLVRKAPASNGSRMALGVALSATGDVEVVRHELLLAAFAGNRDARLLLSYTFAGGAEGRNQVSPVLSLIAGPEPVPAEVRRMIDTSRAPRAGYATAADYNAEKKYFEIDLLRSAPSVMLLPGDWQKLVSPREAGFDDVLALR